ncbi:hypothetical protein [Dactylosporangium sp. CS-033363]|uniref:hypothetical protein n=1 Tax=Dactylosporangium sp. CS-033363 TaxID=3239935 RepID=UPI003D8C2CEF
MATMYLGRPGALKAMLSPRRGVAAVIARQGKVRETLAGGRAADYSPTLLRSWDLTWRALSHDDQATLIAFYGGHNGFGPWAFIDGAERNLLTRNQSAATSVFNDTSGFTIAAGAGETLTSSAGTLERGPRALQWTLPASVTSGVLSLDGPNSDWAGIPCVPGRTYRLQARVRGGGTDGVADVAAQLRWLSAAGTQVQLDAGTAVTTSTSGHTDVVMPATTCPAGGVYLQPRFAVSAGTVSGACTLWLEQFQVSMPTVLDAGTVWVPGLGVPRVSMPSMDHELPWVNYHNTGLGLVEV